MVISSEPPTRVVVQKFNRSNILHRSFSIDGYGYNFCIYRLQNVNIFNFPLFLPVHCFKSLFFPSTFSKFPIFCKTFTTSKLLHPKPGWCFLSIPTQADSQCHRPATRTISICKTQQLNINQISANIMLLSFIPFLLVVAIY